MIHEYRALGAKKLCCAYVTWRKCDMAKSFKDIKCLNTSKDAALLCIVLYYCEVAQSTLIKNFVTLQYFLLFSISTQDSGRHPEEPLNPAEYMSYQRVCNMEQFPESQPAPAYPPVTFLPQHPYTQHPSNEPMYSNTSFPTHGPRAPFTFPKEQSV